MTYNTCAVCPRIRLACQWLIAQQSFDYGVLLLIAINCITLAMERPGIPKHSLVGICKQHMFMHMHVCARAHTCTHVLLYSTLVITK